MAKITKKERFFITGGMGYIGTVFAREALKKGHDVCLYDSLIYEQNPTRILKEISKKDKNSQLKFIIGDTRNKKLLISSLKDFKPTYVLHFGELSSVYACNHNPTLTENINYKTSKQVLDICENLSLKVLYNSTSSVYGTQEESKLMKEEDVLPEPTDYYCRYKLQMEDYIKNKIKKNKNFEIIIFRPATVFGLSPRFRIELLPNHFTYMAVSKKNIPLSGLDSYRAAIGVDELVDGYFRVIEKGNWKYLLYNIGHHNINKRQFALGVKSVVPCKISITPGIGDLRNLQIDCSRFNKEFDFKPSISYEESIGKVAKWIKANLNYIENNNFAELLNMPIDKWRQICGQQKI
ncbi:MAG: NAD(P)-dependent oxidoreductase [Patescibacteria group bacterium]